MNIKNIILMIVILVSGAKLSASDSATSATAPVDASAHDIALLDLVKKSIAGLPGFEDATIKDRLPAELYERYARLKNEEVVKIGTALILSPDYRDRQREGEGRAPLGTILEEDEKGLQWSDQGE